MIEEHGLLRRALPAIFGLILVAIGVFVMIQPRGGYIEAIGYAMVGIALLLAGAICIAVPLSHTVSGVFGGLFFPDDRLARPPPLYSRAEALAKKDHSDDAMAAYEQIVEEYPQELKPYIDMIEIAVRHFHDADRAGKIYQRGMAILEDPEDQHTLTRVYKGISAQLEEKKEWQKTRTLHLDGS